MAAERALAFVDIDGVVADVRHRLVHVESYPKDWDAFFAAAGRDPVHEEGRELVRRLAEDYEVVLLTGRPEHLRSTTVRWLEQHGLDGFRLVMRPHGDRRPARQLKLGLLRDVARQRQVAAVVDDDPEVVRTMRKAGYPTVQADWEQRSSDADETLRTAQEPEGRS